MTPIQFFAMLKVLTGILSVGIVILFAYILRNWLMPYRATILRHTGGGGLFVLKTNGQLKKDKKTNKMYIHWIKLRKKERQDKYNSDDFQLTGKIMPKQHIILEEAPLDRSLHPVKYKGDEKILTSNYVDPLDYAVTEARETDMQNQPKDEKLFAKGITFVVAAGLVFAIMFVVGGTMWIKFNTSMHQIINTANLETSEAQVEQMQKTNDALTTIAARLTMDNNNPVIVTRPVGVSQGGGDS